jgi:hypothetical protein
LHWNKTRNEESFLTPESYLRVNNPRGILEYTGIQDYYLKRKALKNSTLPNSMLQLSKIARHRYHCTVSFAAEKPQTGVTIPQLFFQSFIPYLVVADL